MPLPGRRAAIQAWATGELEQWTRLEAIGVADRHAPAPALCVDGFHGEPMCVPPFLQVRQEWRVWIVECHLTKGWRFNQLITQGFARHPAVHRVQERSTAHALIWIPTCANTFSVEGYNFTKGECAKLAVLDEGDHVGHWPQIRNSNVGVYFKRSWVHKRNGTHRVHHDVPHDIPHLNVKGARRDPHLHEICEGNGRHCKHHGHRAWKNRDHPAKGQYFASLPYVAWDNYTHSLQITHELRGMYPFPVWVLRARELCSSPPVRVVHVDRKSRVLVAIHAKRSGLEHFGVDLVEWSSPAYVRHENGLREALPPRYCLRNEIGDFLSELQEKVWFRVAGSAFFVIDESEDVGPRLCDFNQVDYAVRKRVEASFELFGFGLAELAISVDDHSFYDLSSMSRVLLYASLQRVSDKYRVQCFAPLGPRVSRTRRHATIVAEQDNANGERNAALVR